MSSVVVRNIFIPAVVAGLLIGYGVPGIEDLLQMFWQEFSKSIKDFIPPEFTWQLTFFGLLIMLFVVLVKLEFVINAFAHGPLAVYSAILGFVGGLLLTILPVLGIICIGIGYFIAIIAESAEY